MPKGGCSGWALKPVRVLEPIRTEGLPALNNDHLVSPDGTHHYVSAQDGHIWQVPWDGGAAQQITTSKSPDRRFRHYLHGISPDGDSIAFVGTEALGDAPAGNRSLWIRNTGTGVENLVGDGYSPADGPEFSPDGRLAVLQLRDQLDDTRPRPDLPERSRRRRARAIVVRRVRELVPARLPGRRVRRLPEFPRRHDRPPGGPIRRDPAFWIWRHAIPGMWCTSTAARAR